MFVNEGKVTFVEKFYYGTFTTSCPSGYSLLSCGFDNSRTYTRVPAFQRTSTPLNSTTCQCVDTSGMGCVAWCSASPVQVILKFN